MRRSISRVASLIMVLTVLLATAAAVVGLNLAVDAERTSTSALDTYIPAASTLNQLLASMVDQETGERGYVITAQSRFLQPYDAGRRTTRSLVPRLRHYLRLDPAAQSVLRQSVKRYTLWLHQFAVPQITDVQRGDVRAAILAEKTGQGKALFDSLRHSLSRLGALISGRQASEVSRIKSLQQGVVWLVVGILVCAVVGSVLGYGLLRRWIIRPIKSLERSVIAASRKDAVIMASGPVEIASLGVNVEVMRRRISEQGAELSEQRHVVNVLQEALLPRRLPDFEDFAFASRYLPAPTEAGIGGDWFNVQAAGPHRLFVAVGDVAGKGIDAAAVMAALRFAINAYAAEDPDPGAVLTRLSRLVDLATTERFATVVACLFDADDRTIHVASAGHLSPVLVSAEASSVLHVVPGRPIGLGPTGYASQVVPMPPGATALLFSDGLVERRGEALSESLQRLIHLAAPHLPLDRLVEQLVTAKGASRTDDTIVCGVRTRATATLGPNPTSLPSRSTQTKVGFQSSISGPAPT